MKYTLTVRNLTLTPEMENKLNQQITTDETSAPGQLRKKGEWYYLTYLKTSKTHTFNPAIMDIETTENDHIKLVKYQIKQNRLYINGNKSLLKEVLNYFDSVALQAGTTIGQSDFSFTNYYTINEPTIDFIKILETLENKKMIANIARIKLSNIDMSLGRVKSCTVITDDYGKAREVLGKQEEIDIGAMELTLTNKMTVRYSINGEVALTFPRARADESSDPLELQDVVHQYTEVIFPR